MYVIIVTGGLGAGKSTAAGYFRSRGAKVVDLDVVGHEVLGNGSPVLDRIVDAFGPHVLDEDGSLNRAELARTAFSAPEQTVKLNRIVHPAIAAELEPVLRGARESGPGVIVLEVPLLAEAPAYRELADVVLTIAAPEDTRLARVVARGMEEDDARRRVAVQATDDDRACVADVVIRNSGDRDAFLGELERFWMERVEPSGQAL